MIKGVNHITLAVEDLERDFQFYTEVLGLKPLSKRKGREAFLLAGESWLALVQDSSPQTRNYSHLALSISLEDLPLMREKLMEAGCRIWQENQTHGESFYFEDLSGNRLELHSSHWRERLEALRQGEDEVEFY